MKECRKTIIIKSWQNIRLMNGQQALVLLDSGNWVLLKWNGRFFYDEYENSMDSDRVTAYAEFGKSKGVAARMVKLKKDDLCEVWNQNAEYHEKRYFSHYGDDGETMFFLDGKTSFTAKPLAESGWSDTIEWRHYKKLHMECIIDE